MFSQATSACPRGALARCCPRAPGGGSHACGKTKTSIKMVKLKQKKREFWDFSHFISAPEPPGCTCVTLARFFSVNRRTRSPHFTNEGGASWAFVWKGNLARFWGLQPLQLLKPMIPHGKGRSGTIAAARAVWLAGASVPRGNSGATGNCLWRSCGRW